VIGTVGLYKVISISVPTVSGTGERKEIPPPLNDLILSEYRSITLLGVRIRKSAGSSAMTLGALLVKMNEP
jgi:hypothetical protein